MKDTNKSNEAKVLYYFIGFLGLIITHSAIIYFTNSEATDNNTLILTALIAVSFLALWLGLAPYKKFRKVLFRALALLITIIYVGGFLAFFAFILLAIPFFGLELIEKGKYLGASFIFIVSGIIYISLYIYIKPRILGFWQELRDGKVKWWPD